MGGGVQGYVEAVPLLLYVFGGSPRQQPLFLWKAVAVVRTASVGH